CEDAEPSLQVTTFELSGGKPGTGAETQQLRLTARRGHADFCSVHRVAVQGRPAAAAANSPDESDDDGSARERIGGGGGGSRAGPREVLSY
ncbi:hypothetical protein HK405_002157, partial [Cladochytrium tenue]